LIYRQACRVQFNWKQRLRILFGQRVIAIIEPGDIHTLTMRFYVTPKDVPETVVWDAQWSPLERVRV